jgi:hypothetical protein
MAEGTASFNGLTEDEARTRVCLQTMHTPNGFLCRTSRCMAWRWEVVCRNRMESYGAGMWPAPNPIYERTDRGYCGLAGRP